MKKITIYTNDFSYDIGTGYMQRAHYEVMGALRDGNAVRVGADCIGHTRAAMIDTQAASFFATVGAKKVCSDLLGDYYAL